jgi:inhibitor of cysteine peptidase
MKIVKSGLIITALLLSACQQAIGMETTTPSLVDIPDDAGTAVHYGEVEYIESVLVVYPPAWPEEIQIVVNGFLPDGCTEIYMINPVRSENKYTVKIYTEKKVGSECTAALEPFEETITLDTSGLNSGNYSVDVYGISTNFMLEISTDSNDTGG